MTVTLIRGDARRLPLVDASVDLIVTSPPYFALRSYTDGGEHYAGQIGGEAAPAEFIAALVECTREWMRVLKSTGSIFVNLGDKYANRSQGAYRGSSDGALRRADAPQRPARNGSSPEKSLMLLPERYRIAAVDELALIARAVLIWSKPNGMPESVTDRVRRSHEDWVHLTKMPRYFASVDEIREPHATGKHEATRSERTDRRAATAERWGHRAEKNTQLPPQPGDPSAFHALGKLPGSVWEIASQPLTVPKELGVDHFAAFPMEWPRRIILGWSPPGGVVLDPFSGTGTTAMVAEALGRRGIGVDMSADYCRLAQWRTTDQRQVERASRPAKPRPVPPSPQTADEWLARFGL